MPVNARFACRTLGIFALIGAVLVAGCGSNYTAPAAPNTTPVVTTNPANQAVTAGAIATFTAAASGTPAPTVQWQVSTSGGAFANVAGATTATLTLTGTTAAMNGNQYQAVFTNSVNRATTTAAQMTAHVAALL